jgi:cytochrome c553
MRHVRVLGVLVAAATLAAAAALAQTQAAVTPVKDAAPAQPVSLDGNAVTALGTTHWGDAKAGQAKAVACAACHGPDGNPADPQYPRLAGMPERYVALQLALFKSGERVDGMSAVMVPFASALSAQDMRDVGAYFAQQVGQSGVADDTVVSSGPNQGQPFYLLGQTLYRGGVAKRGIPACMACHGPDGAGNPGPAYPRLAGQQSAYVVRRLQDYRAGNAPVDDPLYKIMAAIAKPMTDEEIQSIASYLQGLHTAPAPGKVKAAQ